MIDLSTSSLLLAVIIGGVVAMLGGIVYGIRILRGDNLKQVVQLDRIEILVDGRYSEVLQELADVKQLLAKQTGAPADAESAQHAQRKADEQEHRVHEADKQGKR